MSKLDSALSGFLGHTGVASDLGHVLGYACNTGKGRISYNDVRKLVNDNAEDVILLGSQWRLLIPMRVEKSGAWEDRLLLCKPGESYELPNVIRYLVRNASKTGYWAPLRAIAEIFEEIGEPAWQQMPKLVAELGKQARDGQVSAAQIRQICVSVGLGDRVDALIAGLKASGVMSPKLGSIAEVSRAGSPLYELNPSLFIEEVEK
jgi:hypothetical protein